MKTSTDPRHLKRIKLFKQLYAYSFSNKPQLPPSIKIIINNQEEIDNIITIHAPEWPVEKLNKVDLAILRLAIYELIVAKKNPPKVIIDEAVELAKRYGTETTSKFINGVLGSIIKLDLKSKKKQKKEKKNHD